MFQQISPNKLEPSGKYVKPFQVESETTYNFDGVIKTTIEKNSGKNFKRTRYEGQLNNSNPDLWVLISLLIGFLSVAFIRSVYRKRFTMLFQTLLNWKLSKQIIRYEKVYTHPVNVVMTLNFLLCFPLFFGLLIHMYFLPEKSALITFLMLLAPISIYSIAKVILHKLTGWLWSEEKTIEEYLFQANLFNKYLGLGFLILTTILVYSTINLQISLYLGIGILALSAIFQLIRGVIIGLEHGVKLYFIILYLCTLEILPWLAIGKWVTESV